jgi:D-3-phosphoglycerate dehydrogenase / 2-oxoglutarate reductase
MIAYVDCSPFMRELLAECVAPAALRVWMGDPDPTELARRLDGVRVAVNGHTLMDAATFAACPSLRSIVFLGTGASNYVDLDAAAAAGIAVLTVKGYGDRSIAEHSFALALAAARRIAAMDRDLRAGLWDPLGGMELAGRRLGVVGAGGIGREVARIGTAFGMKVMLWNRSPLPADLTHLAAPLEDLLGRSDIVSLHLAETPETLGFASASFFASMKSGAIFVNTARGGLVDDGALVAALDNGRVGHAALDVFGREPVASDNPYLSRSDVTLTSHAAFKTKDASLRLLRTGLEMAAEEIGHADVDRGGRVP